MNSIQCVDAKSVEMVWKVLFDGLFLGPDEYVEIAFDDWGKKQFNRTFHVKSLEEFEEKVKELTGKCNIAICSSIRRIEDSQKDKRTKGDYITKQKTIILDIDNLSNHTFLREEDARKWYASWEQVWRWKKPKNENTP